MLAAITIVSIGWSLWVRRATWTSRWEVAAAINIALQGVAVLLMSPWGAGVGSLLYEYTGQHNLQNYIAHDCYIVAASAIVYNNLGRLEESERFQRLFKQYVERPATLCIPLMLAAFTLGNGSRIVMPDFFDVPCDNWLAAYWIMFCAVTAYLLGFGARALFILRDDPRSTRIANIYLFACFCGIATCIIRIYCCFDYQFELGIGGPLMWVTACMCGSIFAIASAKSWIDKRRMLVPA